jgi:anti-sigma B factor antagonist
MRRYARTAMAEHASRLEITETATNTLELRGELDSHTATLLGEHLDRLGPGADVTLDLAGVAFVDSSGLRVLIEAHQAHDAASSRLVLARPSDSVERLLGITGLHEHLHVEA